MATPKIADNSGVDLNGIASLANLFLGKNSTTTAQNSGGTTTSGTITNKNEVSQDAVNAVVQSILQGSQGLASVAKGQRQAGLYNSSTNQLMVNDLIARAAAEGAKLNTSTTQTTNQSTTDNRATTTNAVTQAPISPKTGAAALGGMQLLGMLTKSDTGKQLMAKLGLGPVSKTVGGGANAASAAAPAAASNPADPSSTDSSVTSGTPTISTATSNTQAVGDLANNPSAFTAGSNEQVVNSLTADAGGADFSGDGSFDQTDINGLDLTGALGDVGSSVDFSDAFSNADVASNATGAFGAGDWGVDPTTIDYGGDGADVSDLFDFAEGGHVTKKGNATLLARMQKPQAKGYAGGGYVNIQAERAFDSGGDEKESNSPEMVRTRDSGVDFFKKSSTQSAGNDPRAAGTDNTPAPKSLNVRIIDAIKSRVKGYADGGLVTPDITNTGLRAKNPNDPDNLTPIAGEQIVGNIFGRGTQAASSPTAASSSSGSSRVTGMGKTKSPLVPSSSDNGDGTPGTGVSGTPSENQAAINGAIALGITTALGVPGIVGNVAMDAFGVSHSSMNPVSQLVSMITGLVGPDGMTAAANAASAANTAPSQSDDNAAVANGIAADTGMDPLDALVGIVDDNLSPDAVAGFGVSGGDAPGEGSGAGPGASAGDAGAGDGGDGSSGDGSGSDGGSASAAKGGMIRGPGTSTSDSIPARLSDGEYVIKAAVVDHYGKDFFDRLNQSIQVA